jgi:hypothetical protein
LVVLLPFEDEHDRCFCFDDPAAPRHRFVSCDCHVIEQARSKRGMTTLQAPSRQRFNVKICHQHPPFLPYASPRYPLGMHRNTGHQPADQISERSHLIKHTNAAKCNGCGCTLSRLSLKKREKYREHGQTNNKGIPYGVIPTVAASPDDLPVRAVCVKVQADPAEHRLP